MFDGRIDTLFARLLDDVGDGGRPARLQTVDRIVSLVAGVFGATMLLLQIFQATWGFGDSKVTLWANVMAVVAVLVVCVLCLAQFFGEMQTWILPAVSAALLTAFTAVALAVGADLQLPSSSVGPVVFYLLMVTGLEWTRRWPVLFVTIYGLAVPVLAGRVEGEDLICPSLVLIFHGIGFRLAVRTIQDQESSVEESIRAARSSTARAHEQAVALLERVHWDALVHDHVLNVLRAASRAEGDGGAWLRAEARRSLALMSHGGDALSPVSGEELRRRLTAVVQGICPDAELIVEGGMAAARYDGAAVRALTAAAGEALRNTVRHAGEAHVSVTCLLSPDHVRIFIADDGAGFDRARIDPAAMGIRASIEGRMDVPGCRAEISTAPGKGTLVALEYRTPQDRASGGRPAAGAACEEAARGSGIPAVSA